MGEPEIDFELNSEGAAIFRRGHPRKTSGTGSPSCWTGELYSAPVINGGNSRWFEGQITGAFDDKEAIETGARSLQKTRSAPQLHPIQSNEVDASLGKRTPFKGGYRAAPLRCGWRVAGCSMLDLLHGSRAWSPTIALVDGNVINP